MARDAAAACQNGTSAQTVNPGDNLASIISNSPSTCTLTVNAGTYTASTFLITSNITVKSASGPGSTFLQSTGGGFPVILQAGSGGRCPSGATLDGFTVFGGDWGVVVQNGVVTGSCASNQVTGVTLRNLIIGTNSGDGQSGNGIYFNNVQNSVIDSCTINTAHDNAIVLGNGSNNNIVMNNTVLNTVAQHAILVQGSSDNVIVGNNITGSAFDGILLNSAAGPSLSGTGSSRNRVERNNIAHHTYDGVSLTDGSSSNYVGLNRAVSDSYNPISKPSPSPVNGVGVWVNNGSNNNYVFGNDVSGSPENGIDVNISKSTYLQANKVHGNLHGGIWMSNNLFYGDTSLSPTPFDMVVHGNHVFFNTINANLHFEGVTNADVAYNHVAGDASPGGTLPGLNTIGLYVHQDSTRPPTVVSSGINVYENTITDVNNRAIVEGTTLSTVLFRNKFLTGSNNPAATDGRAGLTYSFNFAAALWDANSFLGGNYWSDLAGVSGNPDPAHQYRGFLYGGSNGIDGASQYVDHFPYASESLGSAWAPYSVSTVEPVAGAVLAAGTTKTIRWVARGCVYVNLYYGAGSPTILVAFRQPNTGHYFWTVPAAAPGSNYVMRVDCLNSAATAVGAFGDSAAFTIATSDLVLMNPGRAFRALNTGTVRVAWKKSAVVGPVNIFVKTGSGGETQVGTNQTGTWFDVTLPAGVSNSSRVTIRIQDSGNANRQDSVDGYFMVRGTPTFTTSLTGQSFQIGSIQLLQWAGASNSYLVDLDLLQGGAFVRSIVHNLPDFGNFTWLVPDNGSSTATIRATFKDASGATVGSPLVSGIFTTASPPILTLQPTDQIVRTGFTANFTVGASGSPAPTFQWQVSIGGGSFNNLSNNGTYSGVTTATLAVANASAGLSGNRYRASVNGGVVTSNAATLTVADFLTAPGDSDGDGKGDLIWRNSATGDVSVWLMNGAAITQAPIVAPGVPLAWQVAGIGDLDGDGKADLVWRNLVAGDVSVWLMNGTTIKSGPVVAAGVPVAWQIVGVGDLDGDGKADIVWRNNATGDVAVWLMNGATLLQGPVVAPGVPLAWQIVSVGDLDGDGKADLIWRNNATGDVAAWLMNGTSIKSGPVVAAGVPLTWTIGGVGDLDGDGKADIVWRNNATGDVAAWLMNGAVISQGPVVAPGLPLAWQVSALRDLNGDGKADIVLRNTATGDVAVWLMNGVVISQAPIAAPGVPLAWQIQR